MTNLKSEIYLDYMASTPCDPLVVEAMMPFLTSEWANPSSAHRAGCRAQAAVAEARGLLAGAIGCFPQELFFAGGASEANNLAIHGCARAHIGTRRKVITIPIEHKSVLGPCDALSQSGFKLEMAPVEGDGQVDLGALASLLDEETLLVSIQLANNEIGTIQPIREVAQLAHRVGAIVHSDLAQALGKIPVDVEELDVDLASMSAHKCYGPKGVGALYVRGGVSSNLVSPIYEGGGQEGGLRPGTENVPGIVGFGEAARLAQERQDEESRRVAGLRDALEKRVLAGLDGVSRNGSLSRRLAGSSSLTIQGVDSEAVLANCPGLALSSSSACDSGAPEPSHVLKGIGVTRRAAYSTVRIGIGRFTTDDEIELASATLISIVQELRSLSDAGAAAENSSGAQDHAMEVPR